jgi:DNA-binding MarR family transcriptional regulator
MYSKDDINIVRLQSELLFFLNKSLTEELKIFGLGLTNFRILNLVNEKKANTASDLADVIGITLPSISELLDKLIKEGLIERKVDDSDKRVSILSITKKGKVLVRESKRLIVKTISKKLLKLNKQQKKQYIEFLQILISK